MPIFKDDSIIQTTWANRGDAASNAGREKFFTDLDMTGYSDGISWNVPLQIRNSIINIATFGDSTANTGDYTSPANQDCRVFDSAFPGSGATIVVLSASKWRLSSKYPQAKLAFNGGVNSETLTQMIARDAAADSITRRAASNICTNPVDLIIVRMGINSITSVSAGGFTAGELDTLESDYKIMLNRLISIGCPILVEGVYGYGDNPPASQQVSDIQGALLEINRRIADYITTLSYRIEFLETSGLTHDATGAYYSGISYDGTHLSFYGADLLANKESLFLTRLFGSSNRVRYSGVNLAPNQMLVNTTAQSYGTLATGYTVAAGANYAASSATIELIDDTLMQTAVYTPTGAGVSAMTAQLKLPAGVALLGTVLSGDQYGIEFDYLIQMADGVSYLPIGINVSCNVLVYKTAAGRIQASIESGSINLSNIQKLSGKAIFNPIKINDISANLSDFQIYLAVVMTAGTSIASNAVKLGVGGYRLVKL